MVIEFNKDVYHYPPLEEYFREVDRPNRLTNDRMVSNYKCSGTLGAFSDEARRYVRHLEKKEASGVPVKPSASPERELV